MKEFEEKFGEEPIDQTSPRWALCWAAYAGWKAAMEKGDRGIRATAAFIERNREAIEGAFDILTGRK